MLITWQLVLKILLIRLGPSLLCFYLAKGFFGGGLLSFLIGGALTVLGLVFLAPLFTGFLAEFAGRIFFNGKVAEIHPNYDFAEAKKERGDFVGAIEDLVAEAEKFPQDNGLYLRMMEVAVVYMKNKDYGKKLLDQACEVLKDDIDRQVMKKMYDGYCSQLEVEQRTAGVVNFDKAKIDQRLKETMKNPHYQNR